MIKHFPPRNRNYQPFVLLNKTRVDADVGTVYVTMDVAYSMERGDISQPKSSVHVQAKFWCPWHTYNKFKNCRNHVLTVCVGYRGKERTIYNLKPEAVSWADGQLVVDGLRN